MNLRSALLAVVLGVNAAALVVSMVADSIAQSQGDEGPWLTAKGLLLIAFLATWPIGIVLIAASFSELNRFARIGVVAYLMVSGSVVVRFLIGLLQLVSLMRR